MENLLIWLEIYNNRIINKLSYFNNILTHKMYLIVNLCINLPHEFNT